MCGLNYLCSECSTELSKTELELNTKFPIGKLYCSFCQSKKERILIKKLADSISDLSVYDSVSDFEEDVTKGGTLK